MAIYELYQILVLRSITMSTVCVVVPPPSRSLGARPLPITVESLISWVRAQGFIQVYEDQPNEKFGEIKGFALIDPFTLKVLHIYISVKDHPQLQFHKCFIQTADGHEFYCNYEKALKYLKRHLF